jgi:hypothetical protein
VRQGDRSEQQRYLADRVGSGSGFDRRCDRRPYLYKRVRGIKSRQVLVAMPPRRAQVVQPRERPKPSITKDSISPRIPRGRGSQVLLRITACSAAVVAALATSFVMAATASAQQHHHVDGAGHHSAAHTSKERPHGASSGSSTDDGVNSAHGPKDGVTLGRSANHGHDKCKRHKGNRPLLPWCTDPNSGWLGSTTLRVQSIRPELNGI